MQPCHTALPKVHEKPELNEIELILDRLKLDLKTLDLFHSEFIDLFISSA
jgi:hypothetical protein